MLGRHVNIGGVFLLTQDCQVAYNIHRVNVSRDETDAFLALLESFHHFFDAAFDVLGRRGFFDELVEFLGQFLPGQGLGDDTDSFQPVFVGFGAVDWVGG